MANNVKGNGTFRRATKEDIDGILAMGDVFFGIDYMAHYIHHYLDDPTYFCYVCDIGGKVAAFQFLCLIDGGESIESGGARVHHNFRGRNLNLTLYDFAIQDILKTHPKAVQTVVFTGLKNAYYNQILKDKPDEYQLLSTGNMTSVRAPMKYITQLVGHPAAHSVHNMDLIYHPSTKDEFVSQITSLPSTQIACLFPDGVMDVFWMPLKPLAPNFQKVYSLGAVYWTQGQGHSVPMLSCVRAFPCPNGVRADHYLFGKGDDLVPSHVLSAFQYIKTLMPHYMGDVEFTLCHPLDMAISYKQLFGNTIPWQHGAYHREGYKQRLMIRHFPKLSKL